MSAAQEAPAVLVVGGRTTGLMLAIQLTRQAIPLRIVDRSPGIDPHARATLLHARSLEIFRSLGLAEPIVAEGQPLRGTRFFVNGRFLGRSDESAVESPFPFGIAYSQARIEALLEGKLRAMGVAVERNTALVGLEQNGDAVHALLRRGDGREERVAVPWLVGCDGAHSGVRHALGMAFSGDESPYRYLLADVRVEGADDLGDAHLYLHDEGAAYLTILDEGRRLAVASLPEALPEPLPGSLPGATPEGDAPSLASLQGLLERRSRRTFRLLDPRWLTTFRIRYRLAPHYRQGRVFLAGDAAHIHSPFSGHGMNTGLQDANNLAWKLALTLRGLAPDTLLDSYEGERRPVAEEVLASTRRITERAERFPGLSPAERSAVLSGLFLPERQKMAARRHFEQIDLDYGGSPICLADERDLPVGPRPGLRAPDAAPIRHDGREGRLFDLIYGPKHCLLLFGAAASGLAAETAERQGAWLDAFVLGGKGPLGSGVGRIEDPLGALARRYGSDEGGFYLIRPDGYVAARGLAPERLGACLAAALGRA